MVGPPNAFVLPEVALSRRALLRLGGAAAATVAVAVLAPGCSSSSSSSGVGAGGSSAADEADPLKAMGKSLAAGPDGDALASEAPDGLAAQLTDPDAVVASLATKEAEIRDDFAQHRTVTGDGWLLSRTEAVTLVAYAGA